MNVLLSGGTGFVGRAVVKELLKRGDTAVVLTRQIKRDAGPSLRYVQWPSRCDEVCVTEVEKADVVVNLAGEGVMDRRWTKRRKELLVQSRLQTSRSLVEAVRRAKRKPRVFVSASAVGFYGFDPDRVFDESSANGTGFLPELCRAWENEALGALEAGVRVVIVRIGIVLGKSGGALQKMCAPYRLGLGGKLGSGDQWMSWIHLGDLVRMILGAVDGRLSGILNGTSPYPIQMKDFTKILAKVLKKPSFGLVPGFVLKTLLGERAVILLQGQRVLPRHALKEGFKFEFNHLEEALSDAVGAGF